MQTIYRCWRSAYQSSVPVCRRWFQLPVSVRLSARKCPFHRKRRPLSSSALEKISCIPYQSASTARVSVTWWFLQQDKMGHEDSIFGLVNLPMGPSVSSRGGWSKMWRNMGSRKAKVLPLPVLAMPMMSLPVNRKFHCYFLCNKNNQRKARTHLTWWPELSEPGWA